MLCRSCTRSFMERFNIYKKFKQLEEPSLSKGQQSMQTTPAPCPARERQAETIKGTLGNILCFTSPAKHGKAWLQRGTQPRSSSNVNCKNITPLTASWLTESDSNTH